MQLLVNWSNSTLHGYYVTLSQYLSVMLQGKEQFSMHRLYHCAAILCHACAVTLFFISCCNSISTNCYKSGRCRWVQCHLRGSFDRLCNLSERQLIDLGKSGGGCGSSTQPFAIFITSRMVNWSHACMFLCCWGVRNWQEVVLIFSWWRFCDDRAMLMIGGSTEHLRKTGLTFLQYMLSTSL